MWLKQSTTANIKLGPFVDSGDGYTSETMVSPTVYVSKNAGSIAARNSATAISHDSIGYYTVELDATDTNTLGRLQVMVAGSSTHLPVFQTYMVLPANIFDSIVSGSDYLDVATAELGTTIKNSIADHVLRRNYGNISDGDSKSIRSLMAVLAFHGNAYAISGSTLTLYDEDDATPLGTRTLTTDAAASPVTGANTV